MQQYDAEWYATRAGLLTSSSAAVIMGKEDTGGLQDLVKTLAFERAFGPVETYQSKAMERGKVLEAAAREWYEFREDCVVELVALRRHPTIKFVSCSPDGLRPDRTVEIKCPLHKAWVDAKRMRLVPSEYRWQARWQLWVCGLRNCDFIVYHPQASGIVIPFEVTDDELAAMEERAWKVEGRVRELHEIILRP